MAPYDDARLVCAFKHSARFDSLPFVHVQGVICVQGAGKQAHVLALGSDDDFEYTFRARVVIDQRSRRMRIAAARCERCWMSYETLDPAQFSPVYEAVAAKFGFEMYTLGASETGCIPALDAHSVMPWMDDVAGDMEACQTSVRRRGAAMAIQRAWRARRWRCAVRAVANVAERRLEAIKRRLWRPSGRLVANIVSSNF